MAKEKMGKTSAEIFKIFDENGDEENVVRREGRNKVLSRRSAFCLSKEPRSVDSDRATTSSAPSRFEDTGVLLETEDVLPEH